jgi:NADPH-dependent 2,4-dienoyl-CoA reductase/sulfur reductase-like enzyme
LREVCVPLCDVLSPVGAGVVNGEVFDIDPAGRRVLVRAVEGVRALSYDRLVMALGSELARPPIPGLAARGLDVDTYAAANCRDALRPRGYGISNIAELVREVVQLFFNRAIRTTPGIFDAGVELVMAIRPCAFRVIVPRAASL